MDNKKLAADQSSGHCRIFPEKYRSSLQRGWVIFSIFFFLIVLGLLAILSLLYEELTQNELILRKENLRAREEVERAIFYVQDLLKSQKLNQYPSNFEINKIKIQIEQIDSSVCLINATKQTELIYYQIQVIIKKIADKMDLKHEIKYQRTMWREL